MKGDDRDDEALVLMHLGASRFHNRIGKWLLRCPLRQTWHQVIFLLSVPSDKTKPNEQKPEPTAISWTLFTYHEPDHGEQI